MKIAVLTGGGVAPGMNAAVRAVAQAAFGKGWEVVGVESGYAGLLEGRFRPLDSGTLSGWMGRGGTMLGTERSEEFGTDEGKKRAVGAAREAGVEGLVVVGGGGSLSGAHALDEFGLAVAGIPATIDNDVAGTDMSIGVDTALNTAVSIIDRIRDTAGSHHRAHIVEVFGRDNGYLAVMSALAGGADAVLTPEFETRPKDILRLLEESYEGGKSHFIVVVSEGASTTTAELRGHINDAGESYAADLTAVGHIQSGGSPRRRRHREDGGAQRRPHRARTAGEDRRGGPPARSWPLRARRGPREDTALAAQRTAWSGRLRRRRHGLADEESATRSGSPMLEAIERKKRGSELPEELVSEVVEGYTGGAVPDYQMSALLMAIFIRGMGYEETLALTAAMAGSGARYSFPECVDKHSTGGVGDKISLTSLPIVAACGAPVAKLSGRGLGTTGGTVDKLEAIPGFSVALSEERFRRQVEGVGLAIAEAGEVAPADKAIYALRDATGTVDSLPLIGSSIVSKKAATGAGHLLYDVKQGSGAFMKGTEEARKLADLLVRLSNDSGIQASALITDMDEPLGSAIGNALEVRESVRFLRGEGTPADLSEMARVVAVRLLELKGIGDAKGAVERALSSGAAFEKFREFVAAQGGDAEALEDLPVSGDVREVTTPRPGHVVEFGALGVGRAALALGAGREKKGDRVDPRVGVEVLVKTGDGVEEGQPVARIYGSRNTGRAEELILSSLKISDEPTRRPPVILGSL